MDASTYTSSEQDVAKTVYHGLWDEERFRESVYCYIHNGNFADDLDIVSSALDAWNDGWIRDSGYFAKRSTITSNDIHDYLEDADHIDEYPSVHRIGILLSVLDQTPAIKHDGQSQSRGERYNITAWSDEHKQIIHATLRTGR